MLVNLIFSGFLSSFYKQYKLQYITLLDRRFPQRPAGVGTALIWAGTPNFSNCPDLQTTDSLGIPIVSKSDKQKQELVWVLWIKQDSVYKMTGTNCKLLLFSFLIRASLEHTTWDKLACLSFPSAGSRGSSTSGCRSTCRLVLRAQCCHRWAEPRQCQHSWRCRKMRLFLLSNKYYKVTLTHFMNTIWHPFWNLSSDRSKLSQR